MAEPLTAPTPFKKARITGPEAISSVGASLNSLAAAVTGSFGEASPDRRKRVVALLKQEEDLVADKRLDLLEEFNTDQRLLNQYLSIEDDAELRKAFIIRTLNYRQARLLGTFNF